MFRIVKCLSKSFAILCLLPVFAAVMAWAIVGGSISGTVTDAAGSVIPGASVIVRETATGLSYPVKTDSRGSYRSPSCLSAVMSSR